MRLTLMSDTHGLHRQVPIPDGDVFIHAGDFSCRRFYETDEMEDFDTFLRELPHKHKIIVAGNHDWAFYESNTPESILHHAHYLQDKALIIDGIKFYGSPWQPRFFDWAFNLDRGKALQEIWSKIPTDTDVLITHSPPFGILDNPKNNEHVGCADLLEKVQRINPKLHVFGHIHESYGKVTIDETTFVNASTCGKGYSAKNSCMSFDL
jgi:Icc-related predicted phosphoesterase